MVATVDKLSVEHVLPQGWGNTSYYPLSNDHEDAVPRRNQLLQTFGNLTLLTQSLNSAVSNGPFLEQLDGEKIIPGKRNQICGQSVLTMNAYFQNLVAWSDNDIRARSEILFQQALLLWPKPPVT